jgi:hypothetical protein
MFLRVLQLCSADDLCVDWVRFDGLMILFVTPLLCVHQTPTLDDIAATDAAFGRLISQLRAAAARHRAAAGSGGSGGGVGASLSPASAGGDGSFTARSAASGGGDEGANTARADARLIGSLRWAVTLGDGSSMPLQRRRRGGGGGSNARVGMGEVDEWCDAAIAGACVRARGCPSCAAPTNSNQVTREGAGSTGWVLCSTRERSVGRG